MATTKKYCFQENITIELVASNLLSCPSIEISLIELVSAAWAEIVPKLYISSNIKGSRTHASVIEIYHRLVEYFNFN